MLLELKCLRKSNNNSSQIISWVNQHLESKKGLTSILTKPTMKVLVLKELKTIFLVL